MQQQQRQIKYKKLIKKKKKQSKLLRIYFLKGEPSISTLTTVAQWALKLKKIQKS